MTTTKMEDLPDRLAEMFKGRDIFITGGTGFLGKVVIEKFLRCLPEISQLYLLVRPKKGKDPKHRLDDIFNSALHVYRFSMSWSRLLPTGYINEVNKDGVRYYHALLDELEENGIEPLVFLHHFDHPVVLEKFGGWKNESMIEIYLDYARFVFKEFGSRVKIFITFNEPNEFCFRIDSKNLFYSDDYVSTNLTAAYLCGHNMLKAHAKVYHMYDEEFRAEQNGIIGVNLNCANYFPKYENDSMAVEVAYQFECGWFSHPLFSKMGDYPEIMKEMVREHSFQEGLEQSRLPTFSQEWIDYIKGSADYFGLSHYLSHIVETGSKGNETAWINNHIPTDAELILSKDPNWPTGSNGYQLFDKVKQLRGIETLRKKVTVISGDVSLPGLGISPEDKKILCERISIVYHGAATVRFDELLKRAVLLNTRGTKQMLDLAKEMKKLDLFAHISTAYCHLEEKVLGEKPYPPPADPHKIIKCVEWMEDEVVEAMTDKILGDLPNTYAFTKALSEGLVEEAMPEIPAIILRPSIVIPIWKEPVPGWTDNINGPTGLLIGAGKGVIRTMYCNENGYADYAPVDICVNAIFAVTWNYIANKAHEKRVYNLTSSNEFKVSWAEIIERGRRITEKVPLNGVVWYPGGSMKKSRLMHNICVFFFHMIPAYLIDALIFLAGHKPIMCRVHRRIQKGFEVFEYYANNQWDFENSNISELRTMFNEKEKVLYQLHGDDMDMDDYFENCIRAARVFILNEPPETLPAARRHLRVMYWVDVVTKILFFMLLIYMLACWSDSFRSLVLGGWKLLNRALSA